MHCVIINYDPPSLQLLRSHICQIPFLKLHRAFTDPQAAAKTLQENTVDLIFCDIQMPGVSGLQVIRSLKYKPLIIFVNQHQELALDIGELDVVDHLVMPFSHDRFTSAYSKALARYNLINKSAGLV